MNTPDENAAAASAATLSKRRERFRQRSKKIIDNIYEDLTRLETLASVQSYELAEPDLAHMKTELLARVDTAFETLEKAAEFRKGIRPEAQAFSFETAGESSQ